MNNFSKAIISVVSEAISIKNPAILTGFSTSAPRPSLVSEFPGPLLTVPEPGDSAPTLTLPQ